MKNLIKKGQVWKDKKTGKLIKITGKGTNEKHWIINRLNSGHSSGRHLHEGTIEKFYDLTPLCK